MKAARAVTSATCLENAWQGGQVMVVVTRSKRRVYERLQASHSRSNKVSNQVAYLIIGLCYLYLFLNYHH